MKFMLFFNKISLKRYFIEKIISFIYSVDKTFGLIRIMEFNITGRAILPYVSSGEQNGAFFGT